MMKIKICSLLIVGIFLFLIFNPVISAKDRLSDIQEHNEQRMSDEKIKQISSNVNRTLQHAYYSGTFLFSYDDQPHLYEIIMVGMCEIWYENVKGWSPYYFVKAYLYVYLPIRIRYIQYYTTYSTLPQLAVCLPVFTRTDGFFITKELITNLKELG